MSEFKRIDNLNEHVLSKRVTERLTAELLSKTGRHDFFVVFLSVCNKKERARVFHGTGSSLPGAWDDARRNLNAFYIGKDFDAAWIKADVVTNYKEIPTTELNEIMVTEQWVNFTRVGISLDADFTNAYIEAEINANKIITYYTEREIYAQETDFGSNRIFLENLNNYRKTYYGLKPLESVPERIMVFTARGFFCGEEDNLVYELYSNSMDYGRRRVDEVTGGDVREIIIGASEYLARQIGDDGKFIYGYFPVFDNELKSYNIVRHASSLWSLINLYRMSGDKELIPKLEASIGYMNTFIEYKDENIAYLVERKAGEIKLGANGVAIIMFTEYMDVFKSKKYVDLVRKFANGILQMQNPKTGGYWHILEFPGFTRKEEFRTVYYDGEATFALARAYTYTEDEVYLDAAKRAVDRFIKKNYIKHRDHWVAYALFEVTKYAEDVKYFEFALRNADENLQAIYKRATSFHTYLEMLMASWRTYKRALRKNIKSKYIANYDATELARTIYFRARHMLNGYFYPEYAMYMKIPEKIAGSFMVRHHNYRVRIDDIQHFIGGYYFYSVYYDEIRQYLDDEFIKGLDLS